MKKKKPSILYYLLTYAPLVGALVVLLGYMANSGLMDLGFMDFLMFYVIGIFGMYIALYAQMVIHEAGHLVFGLKTGYQFSSFRIGSFALIKEEGKTVLKRYALAGTAGQCLMVPPEMVDGFIPTKLYNWGGTIANVVAGGISILLSLLFKNGSVGHTITVIFGLIGLHLAIQNGLPARISGVNNDGLNAMSLEDDKKATKAFYTQLKVNGLQMEGVRIKDMKDLIYLPDKRDRENPLIGTIAAFYCSYLLDAHKFDEEKKLALQLIEEDCLLDIHKYMLQCDLITIDALTKGKNADLKYFGDNKFVSFYKQMMNHPSIIRTEYAINRLVNNDDKLSQKALKRFEKIKKSYMISSDIASEKEIIELIDQKVK